MIRKLLIFLFLFQSLTSVGQQIEAGFHSLAGTENQLPFWLWANQLGRYQRENNTVQNLQLHSSYSIISKNTDWQWKSAAELDLLLGKSNDIRFTELYTGIGWKSLQLTLGAFANEEKYSGLSASNGNLAATRNARPHPKIRAGFKRFVPVGVPWFAVYGFYEEGLLNDERYVNNTHLHRKAFYFRFGTRQSFSFTGGLEHFVMWGGTHPVYGELPGRESYFDYVFSRPGGSNALPTDQANIMGNQFGTYQLQIRKQWNQFSAELYLSHPFDDRSGMELDNYRDNLYGLYLNFGEPDIFLQALVLEYYYTKNQSGPFHLVPQPDGTASGRGRDNYFNHGVYRSGVTYRQFGMVSPFWGPLKIENDISMGFESTRLSGFHVGGLGTISETITWKAMLSYIEHFGNYDANGNDSYLPARKQLATLLNISWNPVRKPFMAGITLAGDKGSLFDNGKTHSRLGVEFNLTWQIIHN